MISSSLHSSVDTDKYGQIQIHLCFIDAFAAVKTHKQRKCMELMFFYAVIVFYTV